MRSVYARQTVRLPNDSQINVPVRLPIANWHVPWSDWITEPQEIKPGVYAASTLLPGIDTYAAIRFINISGEDYILRENTFLGKAVVSNATDSPVEDDGVGQNAVADGQDEDVSTGWLAVNAGPLVNTPGAETVRAMCVQLGYRNAGRVMREKSDNVWSLVQPVCHRKLDG